jgi:hypothetical protein
LQIFPTKIRPPKESARDDIELRPDGWERFEKAVDVAVRVPHEGAMAYSPFAMLLTAAILPGCGIAQQQALQAQQQALQARCAQVLDVKLGMSPAQVLASRWGRPSEINTSTYSWGKKEQWVYETGPQCSESSKTGYLHFDDGILTSINY